MTAKISKWGNSAAIRLPSDILKFLSLHIGDSIELLKKENSVELVVVNDKKEKLIEEAKRIKNHSTDEYNQLEASLDDGLDNV